MFTANVEMDEKSVRAFGAALDAYANLRSDKEYEYCVNRTAKDVAAWAAHFTHHANRATLEAQLRRVATTRTVTKGGRPLRAPRYTYDNSAGAAILAARIIKSGRRPPPQPIWNEKVRYFIAQTLRSINFMRSGWLPAFRKLNGLVHQSSGISSVAAFGRTDPNIPTKKPFPIIGDAIEAHPVDRSSLLAEIINRAVNPRNKTSWTSGLGKYGPIGLQMALEYKTGDMLDYMKQAEAKRAEKFNRTK